MKKNKNSVVSLIIFFSIATFVIIVGINASMGVNIFRTTQSQIHAFISGIINNEKLREGVDYVVSEISNDNYGYVTENEFGTQSGGLLNDPKTQELAKDSMDAIVEPITGMTFDEMVDIILSKLEF